MAKAFIYIKAAYECLQRTYSKFAPYLQGGEGQAFSSHFIDNGAPKLREVK